MRKGRPVVYSAELRADILHEYDTTPKGEKQDIADRLGISFKSLIAYVWKWRQELKDELKPVEELKKEQGV